MAFTPPLSLSVEVRKRKGREEGERQSVIEIEGETQVDVKRRNKEKKRGRERERERHCNSAVEDSTLVGRRRWRAWDNETHCLISLTDRNSLLNSPLSGRAECHQ